MTQEEKAKAYDEALEKAKIWQEHLYDVNDKDYADELNYIFPELAESEDERVRKSLAIYFAYWRGYREGKQYILDKYAELEKQGEQKPTDEEMKELLQTEYEKGRADAIAEMQVVWSEEDEKTLNDAIGAVGAADYYTYDDKRKIENWLKSLKQRVGG